ncbi:iron-dependent repressor IdeR [Methanobrevibacter cuticularis]|uniref:Iron-dependent repressor IdeR n=1 Tax=Methanobrevibacter cuticularis TaxID=47311 RepID=A0A166DXQ6_9EURY|nr:metal-dependent transcriptional regulator [Methanobrevibacter cuticularis]KZX16063.1 iron-dependent repressor IdeR [Methanobrevibacter cuticularis]
MANKEISENIEEYLEVLYKYGNKNNYVSTTKISKKLNIAPGSVTQMLKKLEKLNYISYFPYKGAILTDEGMKIAQKITRKHRILERFLADILKIKKENIHIQACDMEHSLSDEAERAMCHMLEHPDLCPGDKPIPACDLDFNNCEECKTESGDIEEIGVRNDSLVSLAQLYANEKAEVSFIRGDTNVLKKLMTMGIAIGTVICFEELNEVNNIFKITVKDSIIEIPRNVANNIFVTLIS